MFLPGGLDKKWYNPISVALSSNCNSCKSVRNVRRPILGQLANKACWYWAATNVYGAARRSDGLPLVLDESSTSFAAQSHGSYAAPASPSGAMPAKMYES